MSYYLALDMEPSVLVFLVQISGHIPNIPGIKNH